MLRVCSALTKPTTAERIQLQFGSSGFRNEVLSVSERISETFHHHGALAGILDARGRLGLLGRDALHVLGGTEGGDSLCHLEEPGLGKVKQIHLA